MPDPLQERDRFDGRGRDRFDGQERDRFDAPASGARVALAMAAPPCTGPGCRERERERDAGEPRVPGTAAVEIIYFRRGSTQRVRKTHELDAVARVVHEAEQPVVVAIVGYADGRSRAALSLARRRAASVHADLARLGVRKIELHIKAGKSGAAAHNQKVEIWLRLDTPRAPSPRAR